MSVNTGKVTGRRELHFQSLAELLAEAEALVASPTTNMLGNWPLEKILMHLTIPINDSIDGIDFQRTWKHKLMGLLLKRILLKKLSAGFKLPQDIEAKMYPDAPSAAAALEKLKTAVARLKTEKMTAIHPILGKLTHEEWIQLHLRHGELHLSFALPK